MKNYLRFLSPIMLLLMAVMFGGGKILAQKTVSLTLSSSVKFDTKSGSTLKQNGVTWKVTTKSGSIQNSYQNSYKGQQFGVSGTPWKGTFSTSDIVGKITKIDVAANTGDAATLSVKVGNTDFNCSGKPTVNVAKNTTDINTYTFEGNATGEVVVSFNGTKTKACYLGSITVTYNEADSKTPTTLSFENKESVITYSVGDGEDGNVTLTNTAILNPSVANSNITYSLSNNTFDADEILIDNDGTVILSTKKEASATITASYAGNDTYAASTASYTIKVVDPNAPVVFSAENKSFANISELSGSGYKSGSINFVDGKDIEYSFTLNKCMLYKDNLQMDKAPNGLVTSPKFGFTNGYTVTIEYTSGNGITLSAGDKTVTGTASSSISLTTTSDIPFTIKTGSKYAVVKTIRVVPNSAPETETLTTSAKGYATYSADYAVNYSELDLKAYTLTVDESKNTVTAKEFTGVVPAGGAVLVKGTASKVYTLTPATTEGDATFATDLKTGATKANGTQYGFTSKFGTPAFAQVVSGQDIPAKKGYIVLKGASAAKYSICFDDEATGIHTIEAASAANAAMYNLAGQRVDKAYKGIVIVNGKKYLNK